jgi:hypothetical protein
MACVKFKYQDESCVYPKLVQAVNALCEAYKKDCICSSGYRSPAKQKVINAQSLAQRKSKGGYQKPDGSVWTPDGKCWAGAYGKSNHCFCIAMDISDPWVNKLTNADLRRVGLIKPISYEPWHVQLLEHQGISQKQKETIRDSVLKGIGDDMNIKEFQAMTGLKADGIVGPVTISKAKEILQCCQDILGNKFDNPESVIKACMSNPGMWTKKLNEVPHLGDYTMNIVKMMGGRT